MVTVGFPRAMAYYYLYPFFRTFVESLGAKLVVSPPTTTSTLGKMELCPTDEPCVAVKLLFAHVQELLDRNIDRILIPCLVSVEPNNFCCPKFIGIPYMVKNALSNGAQILIPQIDLHQNETSWQSSFISLARDLGVNSQRLARRALAKASEVQNRFDRLMAEKRLAIKDAYHLFNEGKLFSDTLTENNAAGENLPVIGVVGHPYILYDSISLDIIQRVREYGSVLTAEMVSPEIARGEMDTIAEGERLWSFEAQVLGAALHYLRNRTVDRLILVGSFECGPESVIESYVEEEARRQGIPFLLITLDEHTGEAGIVTRIEAFMDVAPEEAAREKTDETRTKAVLPGPLPEKMVIGLPSMGHLDLAVRCALNECGIESIPTPHASKEILELGKNLSPEFVCLPFIITLGQMRYLLDHGATHLMMVGGKGKCRLGWYAQIQEQLLRNLGYDFEMIIIDSPLPLSARWSKFRGAIKEATGNASWLRVIKALYAGYHRIAAIDRAEHECHRIRAFEQKQGTVDKLFNRFVRTVERAPDSQTVHQLLKKFLTEVNSIEMEDTRPVRIRVVGEIWVVLESYVNLHLERMLGRSADPRVWVDREISVTHWFHQHLFPTREALKRREEIKSAAKPYLGTEVGGHGHVSVGLTALARTEGMDGIIHLMPFTCMPEIVAQNILVRLSQKFDIPVLTFILTDQTGEAGYETRVEAFLDILKERKLTG